MYTQTQTLPGKEEKQTNMQSQEKTMKLWRDPAGRLMCQPGDKKAGRVHLRPCFPWAAPKQFLSLRDDDNKEVALIEDFEALTGETREAVAAALADVRFTFDVINIKSIEKDFQLNVWKVKTEQGDRTFQTKVDHWPISMDDGSIIISDLSGDLYRIGQPDNLDKKSARLLWAYRDK